MHKNEIDTISRDQIVNRMLQCMRNKQGSAWIYYVEASYSVVESTC